jgi:hypothetical protein
MPRNTKKQKSSKQKRELNHAMQLSKSIGHWSNLFPPRLITKLRYVDETTLSTVSLSSTFGSEVAYRANSLYDPYFGTGGGQPYGFDQITPWYDRFQVLAADIKVTFYDPTTDGLQVGLLVKNFYDASTLTNATISQAREYLTSRVADISDSGNQRRVVTYHVDSARFMGLSQAAFEGATYTTGARVSADPNSCIYASVATCNPAAPTTVYTVKCTVEIVYTALFLGRKLPPQS